MSSVASEQPAKLGFSAILFIIIGVTAWLWSNLIVAVPAIIIALCALGLPAVTVMCMILAVQIAPFLGEIPLGAANIQFVDILAIVLWVQILSIRYHYGKLSLSKPVKIFFLLICLSTLISTARRLYIDLSTFSPIIRFTTVNLGAYLIFSRVPDEDLGRIIRVIVTTHLIQVAVVVIILAVFGLTGYDFREPLNRAALVESSMLSPVSGLVFISPGGKIRATGLYRDPGILAEILVLALPLSLLLNYKSRRKRSALGDFAPSIFAFGVFLSQTFTGINGLLVAWLVAIRRRFLSLRYIILGVVFVFAALLFLVTVHGGGIKGSIRQYEISTLRLTAWRQALEIINLGRLLFGIGLGQYAATRAIIIQAGNYKGYNILNCYILLLVETGLVGLFAFSCMLLLAFRFAGRRTVSNSLSLQSQSTQNIMLMMLASFAVISVTDSTLFAGSPVSLFFFLSLGIFDRIESNLRRQLRGIAA